MLGRVGTVWPWAATQSGGGGFLLPVSTKHCRIILGGRWFLDNYKLRLFYHICNCTYAFKSAAEVHERQTPHCTWLPTRVNMQYTIRDRQEWGLASKLIFPPLGFVVTIQHKFSSYLFISFSSFIVASVTGELEQFVVPSVNHEANLIVLVSFTLQ